MKNSFNLFLFLKMNYENIEKYIKECFINDGIKNEDVYTNKYEVKNFYNEKQMEYNVKQSFKDYIFSICYDGSFYDFCSNQKENCIGESVESIQEEIMNSDDDYNDINNMDYIYNWYITDRLSSCLNDDFNFFIDILKDIEKN